MGRIGVQLACSRAAPVTADAGHSSAGPHCSGRGETVSSALYPPPATSTVCPTVWPSGPAEGQLWLPARRPTIDLTPSSSRGMSAQAWVQCSWWGRRCRPRRRRPRTRRPSPSPSTTRGWAAIRPAPVRASDLDQHVKDAWLVRSTSEPWSHSLPTTAQFEPVAPLAITGAGVRYTSGLVFHEATTRSPLLRWRSGHGRCGRNERDPDEGVGRRPLDDGAHIDTPATGNVGLQ